jgi:dienelactone hydrolase
MKAFIILLLAMCAAGVAFTEIRATTHMYPHEEVTLEGYLAEPKGVEGKRPGVLVVPDWMGVSDHYRRVADKLADMGYVALVVDMYGKGVRPADQAEAAALATKYKNDRKLMRARTAAALEELKKNPRVDPGRIAAIGYCFGGTSVLESARSGAALAGVVTFHGGLETPSPADAQNIKAKILALHGADDPFVKEPEVLAFQEEMRGGKVDWQMVCYGNAVHSFSVPAAGTDPSKGNAYNESADKRSWQAMKDFLNEIFGTH